MYKHNFCQVWALEVDADCEGERVYCLFHSGREMQARQNGLPRVFFLPMIGLRQEAER